MIAHAQGNNNNNWGDERAGLQPRDSDELGSASGVPSAPLHFLSLRLAADTRIGKARIRSGPPFAPKFARLISRMALSHRSNVVVRWPLYGQKLTQNKLQWDQIHDCRTRIPMDLSAERKRACIPGIRIHYDYIIMIM